jgi:NADPH-dependent glutamate synthase beta subunit-like oxidoreductase
MQSPNPTHCVAVIGGATAGAEIAARLSERGVLVAVFEQNARPYGKIEDGLPRWHEALRQKEYANIASKLSHPLVHFVPNTCIGSDLEFADLVEGWGFTAVVLANGAWRDRPLPVEGADDFIGRGLTYQNPFVIAFNHRDDPQYRGEIFDILDGSIVVGGGLASIDVAKIHTLHCTAQKLAERGIEVGIPQLEIKGIPKILAAHDLVWEDLGLEGCTIYYRRRIEDMPLMSAPEGATPERIAKVENGRRKMVEKACEKFKIAIEPLSAPDGLIVESDRLVGLRFRRTRIEDGRVHMTDETYEVRGPAIVSSIGSIPEPIAGVEMKGELFAFADWTYGRLDAYPSVFSAGNVVTGKGNIVASRKHATLVSEEAIEAYLGIRDGGLGDGDPQPGGAPVSDSVARVVEGVTDHIKAHAPVSAETINSVLERVRAQQKSVGYPGELKPWLEQVGEPC